MSSAIANTATTATAETPRPVSRWIWPGLLIALPASVVVASAITFFFIIEHPDGMVASDYYKEGRAINAKLAQLEQAKVLGFDQMTTQLQAHALSLQFPGERTPGTLQVNLAHSVDPARDIIAVLEADRDGAYVIKLDTPLKERRRLMVTDNASPHSWRVERLILPN